MRKRNIYYDILKTENLANMLVASTDNGLFRIHFPFRGNNPAGFLEKIAPKAEISRDRQKLRDLTRQLREYLQGRRRGFRVKVDLAEQTPFSRRVLLKASRIPYGKTVTYGQLARSCGSPGGARAVGQVMARNPLPIIIPCHRVLASGGGLGGYSGGLKYKRILLNVEGIKT